MNSAHKKLKGKCFREGCNEYVSLALVTSMGSTETWTCSGETAVCTAHAAAAIKGHIGLLTELADRLAGEDSELRADTGARQMNPPMSP